MSNETRFIWAWTALFVSITLAIVIVLVVAWFMGLPWQIFLLIPLWPLLFISLIWMHKIKVPPMYNFVYEWRGEVLEPLEPGWHYPFPYFGILSEGEEIPMNNQMLFVLSGVRDGLAPEIVNQYIFGTASNIEAGTGDCVRLLYKIEIKCEDPVKLVYEKENPYGYIAGMVEQKIAAWVHHRNVEEINDQFVKENWELKTLSFVNPGVVGAISLRDSILQEVGINLISLIPVDVINTPEVEESRRSVDLEKRKFELNKVKINNDVQLERGKGKVLTVKSKNMDTEQAISQKADKMKINTINAIKSTGVNSVVALKHAATVQKLEVILDASKKGNITYVEDSGNGNLSQATAMGMAIHATNPTANTTANVAVNPATTRTTNP